MKSSKTIRLDNRKSRKQKQRRLMNLGIVGIGVLVALIFTNWPNAYLVIINDQEVGVVKDKEIIEDAKASVEAQLKTTYGTAVRLDQEVELKRVRARKRDIITPNFLMTYMRTNMEFQLEFRELIVDGEVVAIVESDEVKDQLLEELRIEQLNGAQGEIGFVNDVELVPIFAGEAELTSLEELVRIATRESRKMVEYEVKSGDTLWGIATRLGTSVTRLQETNEGLTDVINIGDVIEAEVNIPLIQVEIISYPEEVEQIDE